MEDEDEKVLRELRNKYPDEIGGMIDILREGLCEYCLGLDPEDNCQCWNDT